MQAGFLSDSASGPIQEWYLEELADNDWDVAESTTLDQGGSIVASKGRASLLVLISDEQATRESKVTIVLLTILGIPM